jgi:hypothetical protein
MGSPLAPPGTSRVLPEANFQLLSCQSVLSSSCVAAGLNGSGGGASVSACFGIEQAATSMDSDAAIDTTASA